MTTLGGPKVIVWLKIRAKVYHQEADFVKPKPPRVDQKGNLGTKFKGHYFVLFKYSYR